MSDKKLQENEEIQENFCGACAAVPLALAGAGGAAYGSTKGSNKKYKKILLWTGIITAILAILFIIYVYCIKKDCKSCNK